MTPRGIYERGRKTAAKIEEAVQMAPEVEITDAQVKDAQHKLDLITNSIKSTHTRIKDSVMEIGRQFFECKKYIDGLTPDFRRAMKIQSFTAWMNNGAAESCGMSQRTAWNYYRYYAEAEAAGLEDKTIRALAPSVLKSEKARQAVVSVLQRKPELAVALNTAANNPRQIKELAKTEGFKTIIDKLEEPVEERTPGEKVTRAIVAAYRGIFKQDGEFNLREANAAMEELVSAVQTAAVQLNIGAHITITSTAIRKEELAASPTPAQGKDMPLPANQQEAVEQLSQLIRSGAARVVAVGAGA